MDTQSKQDGGHQVDVTAMIDTIKRKMPETYKCILAKAQEIGNDAYGHVRAGLRGEPNRFYAFESGHVVGTPFNLREINETMAMYMVTWGVKHVTLFAPVQAAAQPSAEAACS